MGMEVFLPVFKMGMSKETKIMGLRKLSLKMGEGDQGWWVYLGLHCIKFLWFLFLCVYMMLLGFPSTFTILMEKTFCFTLC